MEKTFAFWQNFIMVFIFLCFTLFFMFSLINDLPNRFSSTTVILFACAFSFSFCFLFFQKKLTINYNEKNINFFGLGFGSWNTVRKDEWNYKIYLLDVESVEIIKLKKTDRKRLLGSKQIFHKYLKINIIYDKQKYIPISMFSGKQIKKILKSIQEINPKIKMNYLNLK